jgi:hypothetical protein
VCVCVCVCVSHGCTRARSAGAHSVWCNKQGGIALHVAECRCSGQPPTHERCVCVWPTVFGAVRCMFTTLHFQGGCSSHPLATPSWYAVCACIRRFASPCVHECYALALRSRTCAALKLLLAAALRCAMLCSTRCAQSGSCCGCCCLLARRLRLAEFAVGHSKSRNNSCMSLTRRRVFGSCPACLLASVCVCLHWSAAMICVGCRLSPGARPMGGGDHAQPKPARFVARGSAPA